MPKNKKFLVTFLIILLTVIILRLGWYVIMEKEANQYNVSKLAPSYTKVEDNVEIYLTAVQENYSHRNKYIKVVLTNDSDKPITYGYPLQLETFIDDKWYKVPMKENHSFPLVGIHLKAHSSTILNILLDDFECLPGKHRIIKDINVISSSDKSTDLKDYNKPENKNKIDINIAVEFNLT